MPLQTICETLNQRPDLTLRAHGTKSVLEAWASAMQQHAKKFVKHPWCPNAFIMEAGGDFDSCPGTKKAGFGYKMQPVKPVLWCARSNPGCE